MADIGRLVELLRSEARVAEERSEQTAHERLREMADDVGEMDARQKEWVARANDDEVRGFAAALRLMAGDA